MSVTRLEGYLIRAVWPGNADGSWSYPVQAWVAQKLVKRDILRVFTMSLFCSGTPIPQEPRQFRSRLL